MSVWLHATSPPRLPPAHMWFPYEATHAAEGSSPPQPLWLLNTDEQLPSVINNGPTAEILMIVNNAVGNIFVCLDFLLLSGYSRGCVFIRDQGSKVWTLGGGAWVQPWPHSRRGARCCVPGSQPLRSLWVFKADLD